MCLEGGGVRVGATPCPITEGRAKGVLHSAQWGRFAVVTGEGNVRNRRNLERSNLQQQKCAKLWRGI